MEGILSKKFYKIQSMHLAFVSSFLNEEDWGEKTISKILQITHSRWVYQNFLLHSHSTQKRYLRRKAMKEVMVKIETFLDTRPDKIPKKGQFLLEFDHGKLARSNIHDNAYWVMAVEAGVFAG